MKKRVSVKNLVPLISRTKDTEIERQKSAGPLAGNPARLIR
jgi:hypothetical protein